jgi:hypothetical protein
MAFSVGATTTNKIENYTTPGDVTHRRCLLVRWRGRPRRVGVVVVGAGA